MSKNKDKKETEKKYLGLMEYAHHISSAVIKPEDKGKIKHIALSAMEEQTKEKMEDIMGQIYVLFEKAEKLKERRKISKIIYESHIPFQPVIGHTYYLYKEEKKEKTFLSLIAPEEWDIEKQKLIFLAKVYLLSDHTWKVVEANKKFEQQL